MPAKSKKTSDDYRTLAQGWNSNNLLTIWSQIKSGASIRGWPSGKAFEYMVIRAFEIGGLRVTYPYEVTYPQKFGILEQIDGVVYLGERPFLVESKDLSEAAAIEAFAKLRFRLEGRPPGIMGILFSVRDFTLAVEVFAQFASPLNVLLWNRADLDIALNTNMMKSALEQKLQFALEYGLPLYALGGLP